jgi:hypothetical protein
MELILRAKGVWPDIDVNASEEEFMSPDELCARRGVDLARMVLSIPDSGELGLGFVERLRSAAQAVLAVDRG